MGDNINSVVPMKNTASANTDRIKRGGILWPPFMKIGKMYSLGEINVTVTTLDSWVGDG
ncbi:hypothetical protein XBJ1_2346 [Xenorhabdus bovienii SS-2004]|uniref:Uncharacterized protein n=1 Tax=Xenorhabdus bovienii (strain SS-2004) TaxID=406818 RepID=D3V1C8_XENBS|nr:hypothetical protein XBJ1_2346 [Xenorhabdus bovienii SS-2004]